MSKLVSDNLYVRNLHPFNNPLTSGHPILDPMYSKLISDGVSNSVKDLIEIPTFSQMEATITKKKMEEQKLKKFALDNNEVFKEKSLEQLTYNHFKELDDNRKKEQETQYRYFGLSPEEMKTVREKQRDELLSKLATQPLTNSDLRSISKWAASLPFSTNKMTFQEAVALDDDRRRPVVIVDGKKQDEEEDEDEDEEDEGDEGDQGDEEDEGEMTVEEQVRKDYRINAEVESPIFMQFMAIRNYLQENYGFVNVEGPVYAFYGSKDEYDYDKSTFIDKFNISKKRNPDADENLVRAYRELNEMKTIFGRRSVKSILLNIVNDRY
jgi:hypothetical protein